MKMIYTTVNNTEQAESIARALLKEGLVACVNMWPISAMYTLNEKMKQSAEIAIFLKTSDASHDALLKRMAELHPYECPAIITLDIQQTNHAFEKWVQIQTKC